MLLAAASLYAAEPKADPFLNWLDAIAQKQLDAREAHIQSIRTVADAQSRQAYVRAKILELIGGLPNYEGPLNARVTGEVRLGGYVIEKVIFESLPHVYVTANLYRPMAEGKYPGILLPLGHWEYGKPAVQRIAGNLALKGFVVLTYDPYGQGERQQLYDRRLGGSLALYATEQHLLAGGLAELIGQSFARYRIWDAKRALDYLVSRPDVISDKIGCTGCSGGGTLTTYISALDPRIKVAGPACYITSFRQLFTGSVGDSEQSFPNFISAGLDLADYVESFAPKPWLISSTTEDFFPIAGARAAYDEAKGVYKIFDAEVKVQHAIGPGGHGTPLPIREAIYGWMIRWLKDGNGSAKEVDIPLLPEHALWATPKGQVAEMPDSREVFDVIRDDWQRERTPRSRTELAAMLKPLVDPPASAPAGRVRNDTITFETEPGLSVTGRILTPSTPGKHPGVLLVETSGLESARARELVSEGNVVVIIVPRGLPYEKTPRAYSGNWIGDVRAWFVGRHLPAMRAHDILEGYQIMKGVPAVDPARISGEAKGIAGIWLLMAAALEPGISQVNITRTPYSFASAFENPLTRDLHEAIIPGFAQHWDIADLVAPSRIVWTDPVDWLDHVVPLPGNFRYTPAAQ